MSNDEGMPGEWVLRALVSLMPRSFRERHGQDLVECQRDLWRDDAEARGTLGGAAFSIELPSADREATS